jgi:anti-anti-sigma regulatory factor
VEVCPFQTDSKRFFVLVDVRDETGKGEWLFTMTSIHTEYDPSLGCMHLRGAWQIQNVEQIHAELTEHLGNYKVEGFDLSQIETCDATGLQLILSLEKSFEKAGKPFRVLAASTALRETAQRLGVDFGASLPSDEQTPAAESAGEAHAQ